MGKFDDYTQGSSTILVSILNIDKKEKIEFLNYLQKNGFNIGLANEVIEKCNFLWVNINTRKAFHGLIGCPLCEPLGNQAITIKEFKTIFEIYRNYWKKK